MSTRLPTEVHERIIDFVQELGESATLASCALTCRAWVPRSRVRLYQAIYMFREENFSALLRSISSTPTHPIQFNLRMLTVEQLFWLPPFIHLVPILLCRMVPLLECLVLEPQPHWTKKDPDQPWGERIFFPIHPLYKATLHHFYSVKKLQMKHYRFYSFIDFQRLVASFPILSELDCQDVTWEERCLDLRKVSRPAPCRLFDVEMRDCQVDQWRVLYFWLQPLRISSPHAKPVTTPNCGVLPSFSLHEGIAMMGLISYLHGWAQPEPETSHAGRGMTFIRWEVDYEHDVWKLSYSTGWLSMTVKNVCVLFIFGPPVTGPSDGTLAVTQNPGMPYCLQCLEVYVSYEGEHKDEEYLKGLDRTLARFGSSTSKRGSKTLKLHFWLKLKPNGDATRRKIEQIMGLMEWTRSCWNIEISFEHSRTTEEDSGEPEEESGEEAFVLVD